MLTYNLLTYNLLKIFQNIWLQQSGKRGAYLYVMMLNDYMQTFKQFALFYVFLHGGRFRIGMDMDEL